MVRNAQLADTVDAVLVKRLTLDGEPEEKPEASEDWNENTPSIDKVQVYESEPWVATWMNLYSASRNYSEEDPDHYHYFVREVTTGSTATPFPTPVMTPAEQSLRARSRLCR